MANQTVLVVEDEPEICELVSDLLTVEGYSPVCVQSDDEAFTVLREERSFACMIVDVNLGKGLTGYDVARFARNMDPAVPVIFVSGQTTAGSVATHGVPGAIFVQKPFDGEELITMLRAVLGGAEEAAVG